MVRRSESVDVSDRHAPTQSSWLDKFDPVAAVRGAWRGFTVLLLGGLVAPAVVAYLSWLGTVWLPLIAIVGFLVAALKPGCSTDFRLYGVISAIGAYLLILPLVLLQAEVGPAQIGSTLALAVLVGVGTGVLRSARVKVGGSRD